MLDALAHGADRSHDVRTRARSGASCRMHFAGRPCFGADLSQPSDHHCVVPFPPGGATDAIARIIQDSMSQSLGQQIVIENVGGAGGMICRRAAPRAPRPTATRS